VLYYQPFSRKLKSKAWSIKFEGKPVCYGGYGGNKNNYLHPIIEFKLLMRMDKFIILIINGLSKIANSFTIHRQVVAQS